MNIMNNKSIIYLAASLLAVGCAEERESDFMVEKPASVEITEQLSQYDVLKNCLNDASMKVAVGMKSTDFTAKGTLYSLAVNNFNAVAPLAEFSMEANMTDDGTVSVSNLRNFAEEADESGLEAFGPVIISHTGQKGAMIRNLYADIYIPGKHVEGEDLIQDFEGFELGDSDFKFTGAGTAKIEEDPKGQSGKVIHAYGANGGSFVKIPVKLPEGKTLGDYDQITYDIFVYSGGWGWGVHFGINDSAPVNSGKGPFGWGCPDKAWGRGNIVYELSNLNLTDEQKALNEFYFATGPATGSGEYLIDNVKLFVNRDLPGTTIIKTQEEKEAIVDSVLNVWTKPLLASTQGIVKAWDVVAYPMSDNDSEMLRTNASPAANEYYYNDILGDNYLRRVIAQVRENAVDSVGNKVNVKLFVRENNLLSGNKCDRLVSQIKQWEADGTKIDGISADLSLAYSASTAKADVAAVAAMLKKLAASGHAVKIASLEITMADGTPANALSVTEQWKVASFANSIIRAYLDNVPQPQRYGITLSQPISGQKVGLWSSDYNRTIPYSGVATALKGEAAPSK